MASTAERKRQPACLLTLSRQPPVLSFKACGVSLAIR